MLPVILLAVLVPGVVVIVISVILWKEKREQKRQRQITAERQKEAQQKKEIVDKRNGLLTKLGDLPIETVVEICVEIGLLKGSVGFYNIILPDYGDVDQALLAKTVSSLIHYDKNLASGNLIMQIERIYGGCLSFIELVGRKHYDAAEELEKCFKELQRIRDLSLEDAKIKEGIAAFK